MLELFVIVVLVGFTAFSIHTLRWLRKYDSLQKGVICDGCRKK